MAQFQRGNKDSLERKVGIMYGYIGAEDFDNTSVVTLDYGKDCIVEMVKEEIITEKEGELIYQKMKADGLCADADEVAQKIMKLKLVADLDSHWRLSQEYCDEHQEMHTYITHAQHEELDIELDSDKTIINVLGCCAGLFEAGQMNLEEAVLILKTYIVEVMNPEKEQSEESSPN